MLSYVGLVHAFILVPINIKYIKLYLGIFVALFVSCLLLKYLCPIRQKNWWNIFNINVMLHTLHHYDIISMKMSTRAKSFKLGW